MLKLIDFDYSLPCISLKRYAVVWTLGFVFPTQFFLFLLLLQPTPKWRNAQQTGARSGAAGRDSIMFGPQ